MIYSCAVSLDEIDLQKKKYDWKRPEECPGCKNSGLWGHGYILRYFNTYSKCFKSFLKGLQIRQRKNKRRGVW